MFIRPEVRNIPMKRCLQTECLSGGFVRRINTANNLPVASITLQAVIHSDVQINKKLLNLIVFPLWALCDVTDV